MDNFFFGVFGLGMSFTVAPLTVAVMGSADNHLSGTVSGVNNAMTRIANVFANAIFGALAVIFFSDTLQSDLKNILIPSQIKQAFTAQAVNLSDAKIPAGVNGNIKLIIQNLTTRVLSLHTKKLCCYHHCSHFLVH